MLMSVAKIVFKVLHRNYYSLSLYMYFSRLQLWRLDRRRYGWFSMFMNDGQFERRLRYFYYVSEKSSRWTAEPCCGDSREFGSFAARFLTARSFGRKSSTNSSNVWSWGMSQKNFNQTFTILPWIQLFTKYLVFWSSKLETIKLYETR